MKIIYHPLMLIPYCNDPAAEKGRLDPSIAMLTRNYTDQFIEPEPATDDQVLRVHTDNLLEDVKLEGDHLYETALMAAGGAITAAELACDNKEATFALIRPPGHHASRDSHWGFCFFCNMAVAIRHLQATNRAQRAIILDFDLHYGDGNENCLEDDSGILIINPSTSNREMYMQEVADILAAEEKKTTSGEIPPYDVFAISAGFDNHEDDWGRTLTTKDYAELGRLTREFAHNVCKGRRFALLEGGYNYSSMAEAMEVFLAAFDDGG